MKLVLKTKPGSARGLPLRATCSQREVRADSSVHATEDPQRASGDKASGQEGRGPRPCACFLFKPARGKQIFSIALLRGLKLSPGPKAWACWSPACLQRGASRSLKPPAHPARQGWPPSGAAPPQTVPMLPCVVPPEAEGWIE